MNNAAINVAVHIPFRVPAFNSFMHEAFKMLFPKHTAGDCQLRFIREERKGSEKLNHLAHATYLGV